MKMNGNYILDTNILIALFANEQTVVEALDSAESVLIPATVLGELYYGAYNSGRIEKNVNEIQLLSKQAEIIDVNSQTAKYYGQIKAQLKSQGTPIPENDIWIAALAVQHDIPLVTRDKHFKNIEGLALISW
jgi:tRNA(fMet)-specific endonuclease VapC